MVKKKIGKNKAVNNTFSCILEGNKDLKANIMYSNEEINSLVCTLTKYLGDKYIIKPEDESINNKVDEFLNKNTVSHKKKLKRRIIFDEVFLKEIINSPSDSLTICAIKEKYIQKYPKQSFSDETLRRYLLNVMDYSFKKCHLNNIKSTYPVSKFMMFCYIKRYIDLLKNNHVIIFIDECSINEHKNTSKFWVKKGECNIRYNQGRLKSISVIGALDQNGLINYSLNENSNTALDFQKFISLTELTLQNHSIYSDMLEKRKITIIVDNSKLHTSKLTRKFLKKSRFNVIFQPSYSPYINGIEMVWSLLKSKLKRRIPKNKKEEVIIELEKMKSLNFKWIYEKIIKHLIEFLKNPNRNIQTCNSK